MPINSLSVGRDCTIDLYDPNSGGVIAFAVVTSFDAKQHSSGLKSKGLDGTPRFGVEPEGWGGKIMMDRGNSNTDQLIAILEAAYYAGQNIGAQTITQTIQEADGTITQWRYTGVCIALDDHGNWQNGKFISQSVS